jgi:hypothetical protein
MGGEQYNNLYSASELLEKASKTYKTFHLHASSTYAGSIKSTVDKWKQLIGDNLIEVSNANQVASIIASTIVNNIQAAVEKSAENNQTHKPLL